jgi:hypothetical protein
MPSESVNETRQERTLGAGSLSNADSGDDPLRFVQHCIENCFGHMYSIVLVVESMQLFKR